MQETTTVTLALVAPYQVESAERVAIRQHRPWPYMLGDSKTFNFVYIKSALGPELAGGHLKVYVFDIISLYISVGF